MTQIAKIIVDVPTMQTNTPYSYLLPPLLETSIHPGMRVVVPFGNGSRKVQGFVWQIVEQTDFSRPLKVIDTVMDLHPVLNRELLKLANHISLTTYAFKITCLLTMLPNALKATYEKWVTPTAMLDKSVRDDLFGNTNRLLLDNEKLTKHQLKKLLKLANEGQVTVSYNVRDHNTVKKITMIKPAMSVTELQLIQKKLRSTAKKQTVLLNYLVMHSNEIEQRALEKMLDISSNVIHTAEKKGWIIKKIVEMYRRPLSSVVKPTGALTLNKDQKIAVSTIQIATDNHTANTFLLEGVTGSGKTEVYLQSIDNALQNGQSALMLVPEISLTPQIVGRVRGRFGQLVAVLHSGLSAGERYDEWRRIARGEATVVVGARSAIFAPLKKIGIIIMDEEHEATYKQEDNPRYHARDIAIWRGFYHRCPVVLGSATPSLESRARVQKKVYHRLLLPHRINLSALPEVTIIDMSQEFQNHTGSNFSMALLTALKQRIANGEQSILMLNRRGYSSFVMCRECGFVLKCPNCDISLILHMSDKTMKCHYCGHDEEIPNICQNCYSRNIRYYGTGIEKVETELKKTLSDVRVIRMDVDTTRQKGSHEKILNKFDRQEADVLLGTQMVAKGLDFPNVTLVGVLNADTGLGLPDFRASEHTFDLLTQVSGRAGRADKPGHVFIQTYNPNHYAIKLSKEQNYEKFFFTEMQMRHHGNYPPYYFSIKLTASSEIEKQVSELMIRIVHQIKKALSNSAIMLGPSPRAIARVNNRYYYQLIIKYKKEPELDQVLFNIMSDNQSPSRSGLKIAIDRNPISFI